MKDVLTRPLNQYGESKENILTQPFASKSPFATDYPEKPKTYTKQSTKDIDMVS